MWHIAAAVTLVTQGACKLEDDMFCDFANAHCHFNYSDLRDADHHSAFMDLISRPLAATTANRGCSPLPDATRNFTISIEPCFTDFSTGVNQDASKCPDVGPEYYKYNGRMVTTLVDIDETQTVPSDLTNEAYISGDPVEYHIVSIGRHFVFGYQPEENGPYTGASNVSLGLPLKDFTFRALPLNSHDFNVLNKDMDKDTVPNGNQCPLEITFADDRTIHMSLKQQYENIYVMFSRYYADLGGNAIRQGRGCYMCYKMNGTNIADAVKKNKDDWLAQYHEDCHLRAREYAGSYSVDVDETGVPITDSKPFHTLKDISFVRDVVAGVYTL